MLSWQRQDLTHSRRIQRRENEVRYLGGCLIALLRIGMSYCVEKEVLEAAANRLLTFLRFREW
jgi:hypothetical protein